MGRDFSERAAPPNLGNLMLRYPGPDVDALSEHLEENGITLEYAPVSTTLAPYGKVKLIAIRVSDLKPLASNNITRAPYAKDCILYATAYS